MLPKGATADRDDQIADLRRRLDRTNEERRQLLAVLSVAQVKQLTDERAKISR
jgi:hypothetical protein